MPPPPPTQEPEVRIVPDQNDPGRQWLGSPVVLAVIVGVAAVAAAWHFYALHSNTSNTPLTAQEKAQRMSAYAQDLYNRLPTGSSTAQQCGQYPTRGRDVMNNLNGSILFTLFIPAKQVCLGVFVAEGSANDNSFFEDQIIFDENTKTPLLDCKEGRNYYSCTDATKTWSGESVYASAPFPAYGSTVSVWQELTNMATLGTTAPADACPTPVLSFPAEGFVIHQDTGPVAELNQYSNQSVVWGVNGNPPWLALQGHMLISIGPPTVGSYMITVEAMNTCGASTDAEVQVHVLQGHGSN